MSSMSAYGPYVSNFGNAQETIIRIKADKSKFAEFLKEVCSF